MQGRVFIYPYISLRTADILAIEVVSAVACILKLPVVRFSAFVFQYSPNAGVDLLLCRTLTLIVAYGI